MKKYNVITLNVEKDEPSFVNDKAKWWLVDEAGDYCLYRVLTNEGESTYIGVQNSTKQVITVTQNHEAAMVALDFCKKAEEMTILKTRNGKEIDTDDFKYYGFGDYVRKNIDENWGLGKSVEQNKTKIYRVTLVASVSATAYCTKTVEAESEEEAEEIAKEDVSRFDWEVDDIEDVDDIDVDDVEEVGEDE